MIFDNLTVWGALIAFVIYLGLSYLIVRTSDGES
jgi:hypothetical protein